MFFLLREKLGRSFVSGRVAHFLIPGERRRLYLLVSPFVLFSRFSFWLFPFTFVFSSGKLAEYVCVSYAFSHVERMKKYVWIGDHFTTRYKGNIYHP